VSAKTASMACEHCGPLPQSEPLFDITGEQFHAVLVRAARGWESYFGPEPAEYEPCGPVRVKPDGGAS
jgi:hypothetical protein